MRTNVVIDDKIIEEAFRLSNYKTKKELIRAALEEFIKNRKRKDLRKLKGKVSFNATYDHKAMRKS